jgi:hypothetical protein
MNDSYRDYVFSLNRDFKYENLNSALLNSLPDIKSQNFDYLFQALSSVELKLPNISNSVIDSLNDYMPTLGRQMDSILKAISDMQPVLEKQFVAYGREMSDYARTLSESLKISNEQLRQMGGILKNANLSEISADDANLSEIQFNGDNLIYSGIEYTPQDLEDELEKELAEYNSSTEKVKKITAIEKFDEAIKKYWLLLSIVGVLIWVCLNIPEKSENNDFWRDLFFNPLCYLFVKVPELPEKIKFWKDIFFNQNPKKSKRKMAVKGEPVFPVGEAIPLRSEPDSKAEIQERLNREVCLKITNKCRYWYKVEYTAQNGNIVTGWVSKRSVKFEN